MLKTKEKEENYTQDKKWLISYKRTSKNFSQILFRHNGGQRTWMTFKVLRKKENCWPRIGHSKTIFQNWMQKGHTTR